MLPTPRTDEAVWAAAALGFLLVLLVLSVLHTRLYRHWRTTPSMYWHDSKQDYDRVAGGFIGAFTPPPPPPQHTLLTGPIKSALRNADMKMEFNDIFFFIELRTLLICLK
jgi:hypothetical protein